MALILPTGIQKSAIRTLQTRPLMAVTRQRNLPTTTNSANDTTSNSLNSRMMCYAPSSSAIQDIVLAYPGFMLNNPETDHNSGGYTVTAAIEYPAGTFYPVYKNGNRSLSVAIGRNLAMFDPCPIQIPAGAQFWIKTYATWTAGNFQLASQTACVMSGEWTTRGTSVADNTLTTTVLTTTSNVAGFGPVVLGRFANPTPVIGILGASQDTNASDAVDPRGTYFLERAMRGVLPVANVSNPSDSMTQYLTRTEGRNLVLRDAITHLIFGTMPSNDIYSYAPSLSTLQSQYQQCIGPFLGRGVQVWGITVIPRTTSTDSWTTTANQTIISAGAGDTTRRNWNAYLRANWQSLGLSGLLDFDMILNPQQDGLWRTDPGTLGAGTGAVGYSTLTGGSVSAVNYLSINSNSTTGTGYGANATGTAVVTAYPGDTGSGAQVNWTANGSGWVTSYTVVNGGSGYLYPPMVCPADRWTHDGVHESVAGCNLVISQSGLSPATFIL